MQSHASQELSRADDLWSVFYVFIEFFQGHLPWRKLKSKEDIGEMKKQYRPPHLATTPLSRFKRRFCADTTTPAWWRGCLLFSPASWSTLCRFSTRTHRITTT